MAILLLLAAYPLIGAAAILSEQIYGLKGEQQEIVKFFLDSSSKGDLWAAGATVIMGAVIAPVAEEIIFRGYIYGIAKRYLASPQASSRNSPLRRRH